MKRGRKHHHQMWSIGIQTLYALFHQLRLPSLSGEVRGDPRRRRGRGSTHNSWREPFKGAPLTRQSRIFFYPKTTYINTRSGRGQERDRLQTRRKEAKSIKTLATRRFGKATCFLKPEGRGEAWKGFTQQRSHKAIQLNNLGQRSGSGVVPHLPDSTLSPASCQRRRESRRVTK